MAAGSESEINSRTGKLTRYKKNTDGLRVKSFYEILLIKTGYNDE